LAAELPAYFPKKSRYKPVSLIYTRRNVFVGLQHSLNPHHGGKDKGTEEGLGRDGDRKKTKRGRGTEGCVRGGNMVAQVYLTEQTASVLSI